MRPGLRGFRGREFGPSGRRTPAELSSDVPCGVGEPSLATFGERFFLTIRSDQKGYVASGSA